MNCKRFAFYWLPAYLYMGLIFYLSSQSRPAVPAIMLRWDKITHFFEYAILGLLLIRALNKEYPKRNFLALKLIALAAASIYGASDEFHQRFVPGRNSCLADWTVDSAGAGLGSFFTVKRDIPRKSLSTITFSAIFAVRFILSLALRKT